jgi:L-ascorbate metabolism protein UlaG (beta-lactamase superfamily)
MELQYHGANCISILTKKLRVVIDDNLSQVGLKSIIKPEDVTIYTNTQDNYQDSRLVISDPGEYEVSEVSVFGIPARSHMDEKGQESATIFKIQYEDIRVGVVGHIHPDISEEYIEELGAVDILVVPVGGNGYTLDGIGALSVIKKFDPKVVIPTHYADSKITYPVSQQDLAEALKGLSMEPKDTLSKFKPKPSDLIDSLSLIVLER